MYNSTLCYIEDPQGNYLMLHRVKKKNDLNHDKWIGIGGKFENGESPDECMLREMREETGLLIEHPVLCGIKDWMREDGTRFIVALYRADRFTGKLNSSEEGRMFWIEREEFAKTNIIWGMKDVLRVCDEAEYSEMFYSEEKESWVLLG